MNEIKKYNKMTVYGNTQKYLVSLEELSKFFSENSSSGVTPVDAPVIDITDPPDDENIQQAFDMLIQQLKEAGVFK